MLLLVPDRSTKVFNMKDLHNKTNDEDAAEVKEEYSVKCLLCRSWDELPGVTCLRS